MPPSSGNEAAYRAEIDAAPTVLVRRSRHPEAVAHDHRAPRHRRLPDGRHGAHALLDGARALRLEPDEEARTVHEIDHRKVEGLGEVHEALHLLTGVGRPRAAVEVGIAGEDGHRPAVEASESRDDRAAVQRADLEEGALVHHRLHDAAHLVRLADVARDCLDEPRLASRGRIGALAAWSDLVDGGRHVGEEATGAREGFLLGVHRVVHRARLELDLPAAELVLGELLPEPLHDGWSRYEEGGELLDHDGIVRGGEMRGAEASHRAQAEGDARHGADVVDHRLPATDSGNVGAARGLDGLDRAAAARALDETDQGQAHLVGHLLAHEVLAFDGGVRGATTHREVVAAYHHGPAIYSGAAEDEVGGSKALELVGLIVGCDAGNLADLVEATRVRELADALADGEAAAVALPLHSLGAAQLLRESLAPPELLQLRLPALRTSARIGHGGGARRTPSAACPPPRPRRRAPCRGTSSCG